jgi:hypothetical protein
VISIVLATSAIVGCKTDIKPPPDGDPGAGGPGSPRADGGTIRTDAPTSCAADAGVGRQQLGQRCTCPSDCVSGFCVDGVCCNGACEGTCRACNVATSIGTCSPLPAGTPPVVPGQCRLEPATGCGFDGTCDGAGACRKWVDGTVCAAGKCGGATVTGGKVCQGGECKPGPTTLCSPFLCDPATDRCHTSCSTNAQCDGRSCAAGSCGKRALGAACGDKNECESGFCADGVCCNLACSGACVSCNQPGKMGECAAVPAGNPDLHGICKMDRPETCGSSGLCNGQGGCAKFAAGTVCKPASCSGGSQIPASTCDGNGTCVLGAPINCFPFRCVGDACKATCAGNGDCVAPNVCTMPGPSGSCGKKGPGQRCSAASECKSSFCVDGVCCDQACGGSCRYCAFPSSPGRCVAVPVDVPDPRMACVDRGAASCGTNGRCNGAGACQSYAPGTVCRARTCDPATNRYTDEGVCAGGACAPAAPATCAPFRCNGNRCATSCSGNDQCAAPNVCRDGSCGKKPNGAVCARGDECASDVCAQGVCCATACTSSCFSCSLAGAAGTCTAVPGGGVDPTGSCMDQRPASCGNDGTCNGMGGCRKYAAGTVCAAATCAAGTATAASTCNGMGTCTPGARRMCEPYVCNPGGTDCFSSCLDDGQCIPARKCEGGLCGRKDNGGACASPDECKTGNCVDGVCCDTGCPGVCKSCAVQGRLGTCSDIPAGLPDGQGGCPAAAEASCGNDGTCNGAGGCRRWGQSTMCRGPSCPAGGTTLTQAAFCDGQGGCPPGQTQSCGSYRCDGSNNMCRTTCTGNDDCNGRVCDTATGSCGKSVVGSRCATDAECASGNCVDKTCCTTPSCPTCQSCGNAAGTCAPVPDGMPDADSCTDETTMNACGTIGRCDGSGGCRHAAAGTDCGRVCSDDRTGVVSRACNGAGTCTGSGSTTSCNGFECADRACLSTCTPGTNAGCAPGKICLDNSCQDPVPEPPGTDAGAPSPP